VYIAGGFGGAARHLADLFVGRANPGVLEDEIARLHNVAVAAARSENDSEAAIEGKIATINQLNHERRRRLTQALASISAYRSSADPGNGLSWPENEHLMLAIDPATIVRLVSKGLDNMLG
jgi:hypothetical protein